jgi:hypothetical protein
MLDYGRIGVIFHVTVSESVAAVIGQLRKAEEACADGNPLEDDTTLMLITPSEEERKEN